ncbi:hypothetical protein BJF90_34960 [Pseudonocardia sp. CNS-004]|nr:hypothetical protein BJF90_34960 [Pseudonocardia sp. CNS-004]
MSAGSGPASRLAVRSASHSPSAAAKVTSIAVPAGSTTSISARLQPDRDPSGDVRAGVMNVDVRSPAPPGRVVRSARPRSQATTRPAGPPTSAVGLPSGRSSSW